ncbi:MAG: autotransporter domain-containing protein [Parvibaculum sp.]|uniref:autotransporter domain-containing protein n=1 Tax=Parvibaculum sp. TaxID=2024848 RepID=UPI002AB8693F|nr:autotransporter domain-containing protein [Parvibaculum sp.]MDZ4381318.1 autotransporter domain-containing protein [Parvibaculum sp.]
MTKRNNEKNTGKVRSEEQTLLNSAYSYYGGIVRTNGHATTAGGVRRLFAAALLSGASIMAVGLGGAGTARAGTCLPQAGPGTQILCIGDFNDTIDIDVEDVTVTLGEGSLVDTTNEEAGGYGDNIGIIVNGDGDQTVVNDGTVLTGDYFDEYGGHHGIVAYASGGYDARAENSSTGIIGTTGEDSYGVYAATDESYEGTATAVNAGSVSTTGDGSHGVHADGKYANVENTGLAFTSGHNAHGLYAYGKYEADVYNSGEVETEGDYANGIRAIAESYFGPSDGDVTVVNAESGVIRTSGEDSDGILAYGESVSVTNAGTILTYGEDADGVNIEGYSVSLNNSGTIKTYGYDVDAVRAESFGYDTTTIVNTGVIASYGEYSGAIEASGPTVRITNDVVIVDDEVVATGLIYSADDKAIDIDEAYAAYLYNNGSIVGNVDIDIDEYALLDNSGSIFSDRYDETTLSINVYEGDAHFINREGGTVTATEDYSDAVNVYAEDGFADLRNYGSISTGHTVTNEIDTYVYGDNATAAYAYGEEGALVLSTGSVTTVGDGSDALYATSEYGLVQALNTGSVQTSGDNSYAVAAYAGGEEVITGYDVYDSPIFAEYGGDAIAGNAGTVQTAGEDAYGIAAVAKYGDAFAYNVFGGSIVTSGNGAHGLVAATGTEFGDIGNYSNGEGGIAVAMNSFPGQYFEEGFSFYGDEGHVSVTDFVDTEDFEAADFRSTIVTTGDFATGVLAVAGGDEQAVAGNFYGDVTTGTMDEYGDATSGNYAYGVAAFSSGGDADAFNKYHATIVTHGDGADALRAETDEGGAFAVNWAYSSIVTHGEYAGGVIAEGDGGDALAANKYASSIVTHGDGSIGLGAFTEGDVYAEADVLNIGSSILTYGDDATGMVVYSGNGDVTAVNASTTDEYDEVLDARIETYGDEAHGIDADAEYGTAYVYNNGTVATHGDYAHGATVFGATAELRNYGTIRTYGYDSDGVRIASESIDTTTVINGGLIKVTGEDARGIYASGPTVNITNLEDGEVYSYDSDAIFVEYADDVTVVNHGTVTSLGADGIDIQDADTADVVNYGTISVVESGIEIDNVYDVSIHNYGSITGRVDVSEAYDVYFLNDEDAEVIVVADNTDEDGGVYLQAYDDVEMVNRGSITVAADDTAGVHLRGSTASLDNSGTIETSGDDSHAVVVNSGGFATTTIYNSGTIEATGDYADAIRASGPTVNITNTEDGVISSADGAAIYAYDTQYVTIVNDGEIVGDVLVAAYGYAEFDATADITHTGSIDGDIDTSLGYSDDTILIDGGTVTGAIYTGDGIDEVTVSGSGVQLGLGIHATESGIAPMGLPAYNSAYLTFEHDDTITLDDGIDGWAISHFDTVDIDSGTLVLDGFGIHTSYSEGTVSVAEGATLGVTDEGVYVAAGEVSISGTLDLTLGGFFDVSGDVVFNDGSTFGTDLSSGGAAVVYGNTITFSEGSTIDVDVVGGLSGVVGSDILIASASSEDGVTDYGAMVQDNTILFDFLKVMNDEVVETGSANDLFLRIQLAETAEDTEIGDEGRVNLVEVAKAIDGFIATQPIDSPLTLWLAQFETEEEQREALLRVVEDTLPSESNAEGASSIASTDLIFDMIMDRISGGGFSIAQGGGDTGLSAGDEMLGGDGKWALWGRVGGLTAEYTPSGVNGFDTDMWGITGGIDGEVATNIRAGFSVFYTSAEIDENGAGANSTVDVDGYGAVAYLSYRPGAWYVNGSLGLGLNEYDSKRRSLGGVNVADYDGTQFSARAEVGHMFASGQWDVTPNVGLRYNLVDVDGYTETGPLPISVDGRTIESLRAVGGVNLRYTAELEGGSRIIPELGVKVLGELADPDEALTGSVVGGGAFTTQTTARDDVSYGVLGGLTYEGVNGITLRVTYDGEFQSDYEEHSLSAAIRIAF